jgi:hypothetical protein
MDAMVILVLIVMLMAAVGVIWGIVALVRRQQYISSLRQRGWTFVNSPTPDVVAGLGNPPFGIGFRRRPDDQITGRTGSGRPFQVIDYRSEHWAGWVGMVTLSRRLPELWITGGRTSPRFGVAATAVPVPAQLGAGWLVGTLDPAYAAEVLNPQLCAQLHAMAAGQPGLNLSIDGDQLVVLDPPHAEVELLGPWLEQLAALAAVIDAMPLDPWTQPAQPLRMTFYHHPEWYWIGRDDSLLRTTPVTRTGRAHITRNVVRGRDGDGPPFVAFVHDWKTSRTEHYTDSQGRSQSRTVTENHSEVVLGFQLPVRMPWLQVKRRGFGQGISFESAAFNERFAVTAQNDKFAYDVIHPRQMEYLMADPPAPFRIVDDWAWFSVDVHSQPVIAHCSLFLRGFLSRIPRFVWQNVGLADTPYPVHAPSLTGSRPVDQ